MTDEALEKILLDPGIIRNRLKIFSVRKNAIVALRIQQEFGSLDAYFWETPFVKVTSYTEGGIRGIWFQRKILSHFVTAPLQRSSRTSQSSIIRKQ
jgi:3-methyladenine DNA glycosylase Tag